MEKLKNLFVKLAISLAIFTPLFFAISSLGVKFGFWDWKYGFGVLVRGYGTKLLMLTAAVALIALLLAIIIKPRKGILTACLALIIPIAGIAYGQRVKTKVQNLPFIHDITSDTENPPIFSQKILALRENCTNSLEYKGVRINKDGPLVSEAQKSAYPDIKPIIVDMGASEALELAKQVLANMGLEIINADKQAGIIEARDLSFWFGFADDLVVRATPLDNAKTRIDIRSVSCVGKSDIGVNAKRIRKFSELYKSKLK